LGPPLVVITSPSASMRARSPASLSLASQACSRSSTPPASLMRNSLWIEFQSAVPDAQLARGRRRDGSRCADERGRWADDRERCFGGFFNHEKPPYEIFLITATFGSSRGVRGKEYILGRVPLPPCL
jgi:hypothetical protein